MKNKFTLGARLSLVLSLTIASSLVANAAQAESRQERQAKEELTRTITELVDLGADRQWLVEAALNRATTQSGRRATAGVPDARSQYNTTAGMPDTRSQQRR
jgi:hypothetical protein